MIEAEGQGEIFQVIAEEEIRPDGTTGTFRSYLFIEGKRTPIEPEMSHAVDQSIALTPREVADKLEELRGDPAILRELAGDIQERDRGVAHSYLGPRVNEEVSW